MRPGCCLVNILLWGIVAIAHSKGWYQVRDWVAISVGALYFGVMLWMAAQSIHARPLMKAAREGDAARVRELLDRGISPNMVDGQGNTALHWAARNGHIELAKMLIEAGADVNAWGPKGRTPLSFAMDEGQDEVAELIRSRGGTTTAKLWDEDEA